MKVLITMLASAVAGVVFADYNWINPDVNTAASPFALADPANWDENGVPASSSASVINFTNAAGGYRFVTVPDDFAFSKVKGNNASPVVLIGSGVKVNWGLDHVSGSDPAQYLYATAKITSGLNLNRSQICGDIDCNGDHPVYQASGDCYHRLDLYANAAGEERLNPSTTFAIANAYGTFHIYAPQGSDEAITATWRLSNGSAVAFRAEGQDEHVLCAGTLVTAADGILPDGTFLKRIFPDGSIELSSPATLAGASADVALTFAAFSPKVEQHLSTLSDNGGVAAAHVFDVSKWRDADSFDYWIHATDFRRKDDDPLGTKSTLTFTSKTGVPGRILTTDVYSHQAALILDNCHLQFENPLNARTDGVAGFRDARKVTMNGTASKARITVTNNITAYFGGLTKIDGTFRKDGAGTLIARFGNEVTAGSASDNAGQISVDEGTMEFVSADGSGEVGIAKLAVAAEATVQVPEDGLLKVTGTFTAAAGATISGPGAVMLPNGFADLAGVRLVNGASVRLSQNNVGAPIYEQPKGLVPAGTPAFWADASQGVTADGSGNVTRWNDCRGTGYMFATNVATVYPTLEEDQDGRKYLKIVRNADAKKTEIEKTGALVWNVPLSNIRAVFAVMDLKDGGGVMLGSSPRITTSDYYRDAGWAYWNQVMSGDNCTAKVRNGKIFTNGEPIAPTGIGFPYCGYDYSATGYRKGFFACPMCISMVPNGETEADCFGFCNKQDGCNGQSRIYEYVIYTNALTTAERLETEEYLMKKWMSAHANYDRLADVTDRLPSLDVATAPAVDVAAGTLVAIDTVSGDGTLGKTGAGTMYVEDLASDRTSVEVRGGVLNIRSVRTTADTLPVEPVVHFDASDLSTLTAATNGDIVTVTEMRDRRGAGYPKAVMVTAGTSLRLNETATVGGLTMADFGPFGESTAMKFDRNGALASYENLRTTVSVIGTKQGGGCLVGEASGSKCYHDLGGIYRASAGSAASPIVSTAINRPAMISKNNIACNRTRLNGTFVNPGVDGFSGGYDLVSLALYDCFGASGIGLCNYAANKGGLEFGEQMLFDETLSREQVLAVEAYLNRKWFGVEKPAYRGSRAASLAVSGGATVNVLGDSPFVVGSLSGSGAVNGPVRLAAGGELVVSVDGTGAVSVPSCAGLDFAAGGVIRFAGSVDALPVGRVVLMRGVTAAEGALAGWTVENPSARRVIAVSVADGNLVADVTKLGFVILLK